MIKIGKYKVTPKEIKNFVSMAVMALGGYLVIDPLSETVKHFINGTNQNIFQELVGLWSVDYKSIIFGVIIIIVAMYFFKTD